MDLQMPVMDGFGAVRRIRDAEGWRPRTPIVALTANAMTGQLERCLAAGMDGFLSKPLEIARLRETLHRFGLTANAPASDVLDDAAVGKLVSNPSAVEPAVDLVKFAAAIEGDHEFARDLIATFAASSAEILDELRSAHAANDRQQAARAAHKLKGANANMFANRLQELCAALESGVSSCGADEWQAHIGVIALELQRANGELQQYCGPALGKVSDGA
jgi:HPt (histidine-containing phosphotransfer) domain-containing protein